MAKLSAYYINTILFIGVWQPEAGWIGLVQWSENMLLFLPLSTNDYVCILQVMETKNMLYIVSEFAQRGEMFGNDVTRVIQRSRCLCPGVVGGVV